MKIRHFIVANIVAFSLIGCATDKKENKEETEAEKVEEVIEVAEATEVKVEEVVIEVDSLATDSTTTVELEVVNEAVKKVAE